MSEEPLTEAQQEFESRGDRPGLAEMVGWSQRGVRSYESLSEEPLAEALYEFESRGDRPGLAEMAGWSQRGDTPLKLRGAKIENKDGYSGDIL